LAITRERKEELVAQYADLLQNTGGFVVTSYNKMTVKQVNDIRNRLADVNGKYVVTKNTLFARALQEGGWPVPEKLLLGTTAIAFGDSNFPAVAKAVVALLKDYEEVMKIKGGVMAGTILNPAQVEMVSNLPTLDELRAQLAGLISQPAAGLVSVLNAGVASVAQVLQAYVTKNEAA
jgi:large subunit ribosomal protein L10